ncbi:MAG: hypothetical protein Q7K44_02750 [Candidatus Liptonbacteria bacterium]|nr:hypothetical protein [Candidatus Liptonbacteria bacterium]
MPKINSLKQAKEELQKIKDSPSLTDILPLKQLWAQTAQAAALTAIAECIHERNRIEWAKLNKEKIVKKQK